MRCWQAAGCWLRWAGWARSGTAWLVPGVARGRPGSRGEGLRFSPPPVPPTPRPSSLGGGDPPPVLHGDNGGRDLGLCEAQVSGNVSSLRAPGAGVPLCFTGGQARMRGLRERKQVGPADLGFAVSAASWAWGALGRAALGPVFALCHWGWPVILSRGWTAGRDLALGVGQEEPQSGWGSGAGRSGWAFWKRDWVQQVGGPLKVRQACSPSAPGQGASCSAGTGPDGPRPTRLGPGTEGWSLQRGD